MTNRFRRPKLTESDGTEPAPVDYTFDADIGRLRHARAMRRVYLEELERVTFYRDRYGIPFVASELAGYAYRDPDDPE